MQQILPLASLGQDDMVPSLGQDDTVRQVLRLRSGRQRAPKAGSVL